MFVYAYTCMIIKKKFDLQLQIWDTAGQERFRSITQSYYHSANGLILVYDVCCQQSFDNLPMWIEELEKYASTKVFSYLVGEFYKKKKKKKFHEAGN